MTAKANLRKRVPAGHMAQSLAAAPPVDVGSENGHRPLALVHAGGQELPVWAGEPDPVNIPAGNPFVTNYTADRLAWPALVA